MEAFKALRASSDFFVNLFVVILSCVLVLACLFIAEVVRFRFDNFEFVIVVRCFFFLIQFFVG